MPPKIHHRLFSPSCFVILAAVMSWGCNTLPTRNFDLDTKVPPEHRVPNESYKTTLPPYFIEPPDVISIDAVRIVPKQPYRLQIRDVLTIQAEGVFPQFPIPPENNPDGFYQIDSSGKVDLGNPYGEVELVGLTIDEAKEAIDQLLREQVVEPVVTVRLAQFAGLQQISGDHPVAADGTVNLGTYGQPYVAGMTLSEAKAAIEKHLETFLQDPEVIIDVTSFNSKFYYVITEGAGSGDQIVRVPIVGGETVLDAVSQIGGLSAISTRTIWIARPVPDKFGYQQRLDVDWTDITANGIPATNYQMLPGDRLFIKGNKLIEINTVIGQVLAPVQQVSGFISLGANSIRSLNSSFRRRFGGNNF